MLPFKVEISSVYYHLSWFNFDVFINSFNTIDDNTLMSNQVVLTAHRTLLKHFDWLKRCHDFIYYFLILFKTRGKSLLIWKIKKIKKISKESVKNQQNPCLQSHYYKNHVICPSILKCGIWVQSPWNKYIYNIQTCPIYVRNVAMQHLLGLTLLDPGFLGIRHRQLTLLPPKLSKC